jgi:hypothetical protein
MAGLHYSGFPAIYYTEVAAAGGSEIVYSILSQSTRILTNTEDDLVRELLELSELKAQHRDKKRQHYRELQVLESQWRVHFYLDPDPELYYTTRKEWLTKRTEYNKIKHWPLEYELRLDSLYNHILGWVL